MVLSSGKARTVTYGHFQRVEELRPSGGVLIPAYTGARCRRRAWQGITMAANRAEAALNGAALGVVVISLALLSLLL